MATTDGLLSMAESHGAVSDPTQPSTAADGPVSFLDSVSSLGDPQTLQCLLDHQGSIRHRLQDTTRTLKVFNAFSAARFAEDAATIDEYTKLLKQTQLDLEVCLKRIR
ncbi:hypothetical protein BASA84_001613 [Batrachochytrium salamandrivorans]|nr:hypothetical protein BASA84_001613 [Batrachochytrium salamandrivorans]